MRYRINRRTGDKISEIGMGTAYVVEADHSEAVRTVRRAYEGGINYYDLNSRCPFSVDQMSRMKEIGEYFGE